MVQEMKEYFEWLLAKWQTEFKSLPRIPFDPDVASFLYRGEPDEDDWVQWQPVKKTEMLDVQSIGREFKYQLCDSFVEYWNTYWFAALGGMVRGTGVNLIPVLPGKEANDLASSLEGYRSAHDLDTGFAPLGFEKNGLLLVVRNFDGRVFLEDYENATFSEFASSIDALIAELR